MGLVRDVVLKLGERSPELAQLQHNILGCLCGPALDTEPFDN